MKKFLFFSILLWACTSCALKCRVEVSQSYAPTSTVSVIQMGQSLPTGLIRMGSISVGEGGMTPTDDCTYEACRRALIERAKEVGADIVYIIQVITPSSDGGVAYGYHTGPIFYGGGSTCYGIVAEVYKQDQTYFKNEH